MERLYTDELDMRYFVRSAIGSRAPESNKGDYGKLLALCGSTRYRGAALMVAEAALRAGAGIVCLASVEEVLRAAVVRTPECVCLPMSANPQGSIAKENSPAILAALQCHTACLCGCGMTDSTDTLSLVEALLTRAEVPLVLDADALNVLRGRTDLLKSAKKLPVITPHPGEMSRLTGMQISDITANADRTALCFAQTFHCVTVLKGHSTRVASPDGRLYVNRTGNPGLARGGSGDVLAGMIGAFAARGIPSWEAAVCGVYLHGLAADRCANRISQNGMLPTDILRDLCTIFLEFGL